MVALPLLVLLGIGCRALLATDGLRRRYATLPGQAKVLFNSREPIDIVVVGTSRSVNAIDKAVIGASATDEPGVDPVVVNLAHPWQADEQNYRMLRDLFALRPVRRAILYEISREARVLYYHYYPNFSSTNTFRDLLDDCASKPREPRLSRLRDLLELLLRRVDQGVSLQLRRKNKDAFGRPWVERLLGEMKPAREKGTRQVKLRRKRAEIEAAYESWDRAPATRWSLEDINEDRTNHYLSKTIALAREHNVATIFYFVPAYLDTPVSEETRLEFQKKFGIPLLTPGADVLARLYDGENFVDLGHMNPREGRQIFSAWLAGAVQSQLRPAAR